ncbi:MAG: family deacetylase [Sphingobacteriaceae bacterium]|jgi:LmbE family N-acetylglucosaminyl deacetylase|nr:family deacetylase [Sphingobacteriaceae bacterium]
MRITVFATAFIFFIKFSIAQTSPQLNSAEIQLGLKKLNVLGSVLYIAAHPDDENTRLLAYLAKEKLYRTGYLSLTRGDGGQNLIGSEQGDLLGVIRTQELLGARKIDGTEQFFTRANDFGFSKTADETLKIWDKEMILSDVVWAIRKFRPDVIITRFPSDSRAGHGHHQSSSILAQEAFSAAADPNRFPGQLKYVSPWQAKRILWNTFNFGGMNTTSEDQLKIDIGAYNSLLGKTYGELAAESRSNHKSQGMGSTVQRGQSFEYFSLWKGDMPKAELMEGITASWERVKGSENLSALVKKIYSEYNPEQPQNSVAALVSLLSQLESLKDNYWKEQKSKEVKNLIAQCAGLWFESYSPDPTVAIGSPVTIRSQILLNTSAPIKLVSTSVSGETVKSDAVLATQKLLNVQNSVTPKATSQPYWLSEKHPTGNYSVANQLMIGSPENPEPLSIHYEFEVAGKRIEYVRPVVYKYTDPIRGEVYQPLAIAPPITANLENKVLLFSGGNPKTVSVRLKAFKDEASGTLRLDIPQGWTSEPSLVNFALKNKGDERLIDFRVSPSAKAGSGTLTAVVETGGSTYSQEYKTINYNHIPLTTLFPGAEAKLVKLDLKTAGKKIGYIAGAGDLIPDMLKQIGYDVDVLSEKQISDGNLSAYDAIVTGVRAYNIDPRLKFQQPNLLKYVENGGNLVIQYNVNRPLQINQIGPYPFTIGSTRVTEEDAMATITDPGNEVLNYPNKITRADFNGWIQERGIYFAQDIDPRYQTPLSMHDTGEKPSNGSLLVANYGKGRFVYTSLVFFRELPAGVPGAYRLFVNLLARKQ